MSQNIPGKRYWLKANNMEIFECISGNSIYAFSSFWVHKFSQQNWLTIEYFPHDLQNAEQGLNLLLHLDLIKANLNNIRSRLNYISVLVFFSAA